MKEPRPLSKHLLERIRDNLVSRIQPNVNRWREGEDLVLLDLLDEALYESTGLYSGEEE